VSSVGPWLDNAERALAASPAEAAPQQAESSDLRTLPSTIAMYRAAVAQARGDASVTAKHARRALDLAGPDDHLARGGAAGFLAFAAWAQGDVPTALETFTQAVASLHAAGTIVDALSGTVVLADLWLAAGRPSTARRLCAQALEMAETHGAPVARATAELHVKLSELDMEMGDVKSARQHLHSAAALADRVPKNESSYRWFVAKALLARADDDPAAAVQHFDQAEQLHRPGFFPELRPIAAMRARTWIMQDNLAEAAGWARAQGVSTADEARYLSEYDHLTLVRLLLAQSRTHQETSALRSPAALLDRLHASAETAQRAGSVLEIGLLQALVHDAQGDRSKALHSLAQALELAPDPDGYLRLFLDEGAAMVSLLRDVNPDGPGGHQARRLVDVGAAAQSAPTANAEHVTETAAESLSDRELQVLRLLEGELTGPQIARQLFVSHNTVRTHTKHIFTKLDVTNRRAAVLLARERGLI
jgi:LuxR family maltose regulon positive regulatory protein